MPAKAIVHRAEILRRVAKGDRLADIAQAIGYKDHTGISQRLRSDPDYRNARIQGLHQRIANASQGYNNVVTVARARQCCRWATLALRSTLARWAKE